MTAAMPEPPGIDPAKAKILRAATRIVAEQGAEQVSLAAVSLASGVSLAVVKAHFKRSGDLLRRLAIDGFEDLHSDIIRAERDLERSLPMRGAARALFNFALSRTALFVLMFVDRLSIRDEAVQAAEGAAFRGFEAKLMSDDQIPAEHRRNAALALWALGRGMAAVLAAHPGRTPPRSILEDLLVGVSYLVNDPT